MAEDRTASLDYAIPTHQSELSVVNSRAEFWWSLNHVWEFLQASPTSHVVLRLPNETADGVIRLEAKGLTFRSAPIDSHYAHRVGDGVTGSPAAVCSLTHRSFARALTAANVVGNHMQISLDPESQTVEFSASNQAGDAFTFAPMQDDIADIHGSASRLTVGIDRLRDVTRVIPPESRVKLQITDDCLVYNVGYPFASADLRVYVAERLGKIPR